MSKKILVIDDSEQDRKIIKRFLAKAGFEDILFSENGEDGVKAAAEQNPDVVITDTMMPGINGFETCRLIRERSGPDRPKIIIMTGVIDAVDAVKARQMGADDYCVKTSDCAPILGAVKNLVSS